MSLFSTMFILAAVLLISVVPSVIDNHQSSCTEPVTATIVDVLISQDSDDYSDMYAPVYEYYLNGNSYRKESHLYTSQKIEIGAQVDLLVDPDNPEKVSDPKRINFTKRIVRIVGYCMAVPASIFTIITIILFVKKPKPRYYIAP